MSDVYENLCISRIDAQSRDLKGKEFCNCDFCDCDFSGGDFSGARFDSCSFEACNFSLVKFASTALHKVRFERCKLLGVVFSEIDSLLLEISFQGCLLQNCDFSRLNLKGTVIRNSELRENDFINCNLSGADFYGSNLERSVFHDCDLSKADFSNAVAYTINPLQNRLTKAVFELPEAASLLRELGVLIK